MGWWWCSWAFLLLHPLFPPKYTILTMMAKMRLGPAAGRAGEEETGERWPQRACQNPRLRLWPMAAPGRAGRDSCRSARRAPRRTIALDRPQEELAVDRLGRIGRGGELRSLF